MLTVFIATFVIFALVIFGMSLGYLVKRKSIQGSPRWGWRKSAIVRNRATRVKSASPARRSVSSGVFCNARRRCACRTCCFSFVGRVRRQPPPGIKRLRARRRCACRGCCFGLVGRVRRQPPPGNNMPAM